MCATYLAHVAHDNDNRSVLVINCMSHIDIHCYKHMFLKEIELLPLLIIFYVCHII